MTVVVARSGWIAAALLCAALAAASPARVTRPGAELRAEPGFAGPVTARPAAGSDAEIVESRKEWRRVRLPAGEEGWVHELFVQGLPAAASPPTATPAPAPAPAPSPADRCVAERGELKSEVARLSIELGLATKRAEAAEASAARLDAELKRLREAPPAAPAEDACREAISAAVRDADDRCAQEMAAAVQAALESTIAAVTSSEEEARRIDHAVEQQVAVVRARCEMDLAACRAAQAPAADVAALQAELAAERQARADEVRRIEDEHQKLHDTYVEIVTTRHEEALQRERQACDDACERLLLEERRRHDREIRTARKESGYEVEMEKELRERTKLAIEEAEARWEAKRRGEAYDEQRVRQDEEARVRRLCDAERFTAVQAALSAQGAELEARRRREVEESDLRCQVALEVVLERAAAGDDLTQVRDMARERTRRAEPPAEAP